MPKQHAVSHSAAKAETDRPRAPQAAACPSSPFEVDEREERLFRSLDFDNDQALSPKDFERVLAEIGIRRDDRRLRESMVALDHMIDAGRAPAEERLTIPRDAFCEAVRPNILLIERALQGRMVIPDFAGFCAELHGIYDAVRANRNGTPADYIPILDLADPEADSFALAFCTVDGQRFSLGESRHFFSVQSTCKPVSYCLALEEHGEATVHRHIGQEPSGASFNELALNKGNVPHNPMINAGAIMSSALIGLREKRRIAASEPANSAAARGWSGARFDRVMAAWQALCGGETPRFSTATFLSERETADRNFALAYFMREKQAFPADADIHDVLEFYMQCCSIELTAEMMSLVAATFASGGVCPVTGERIFRTETVRNCLSLMASCGMYDFSGEFAFSVGLPAKSGVSGAIMVVIPNVMGFCVWSPRLDSIGNSVRGLDFCRRLVERFNFHNFDDLTGHTNKKDPRLDPIQIKARQVNEMILAASKGDLGAIHEQLQRGSQLTCKDYDRRTPLHLAAAENQAHVVHFFIEEAAHGDGDCGVNPLDRWGGTPLDDAYLQGHQEVIALLEAAGGRRGEIVKAGTQGAAVAPPLAVVDSLKTGELIWAASLGDLASVRRLVAQGVPLEAADYDRRTALHLAAAEGHLDVVRFFLAHGTPVAPRDRWGNTPLDDALRHGHDAVARLLAAHGGRRRRRGKAAAARAAARKAAQSETERPRAA